MTRHHSVSRSLTALSMGAALLLAAAPPARAASRALAPAKSSDRAKRLNAKAQAAYDRRDLVAAATTWARILDVLAETGANTKARDNALLVSLAVHGEAFADADKGGERTRDAIQILRNGVVLYEKYEVDYHAAYGETALPSEAAREAGVEIKRLLVEAEAGLGPLTVPPVPDPPPGSKIHDDGPTDERPVADNTAPSRPSGDGLLAGGATTVAAGLAASALVIVGAQRSKAASVESQAATTQEQRDDAEVRGRSGDTMIAVGATVTAVLVAGGVTMLVFGIRRRTRSTAFVPQLGPGYVGTGFSGRF